jgi:elongation factor Ts
MGWSKATKLEGRSTKQGLVGVLIQKNIGTLVEVNCETDFVARNENFKQFVEKASQACAKYVQEVDASNITKIVLEAESLKNLKFDDGKSMSDHLALMIGTVGENATLRRAICYKAPEAVRLYGFTHPAPESLADGTVSMGKYGSIAAFNSNIEHTPELQDIYKKICQHIIGLNPSKIGDAEKDKPNETKDDEKCLIYQEFVLDPEVTVGELLAENNIKIIDFQRYECGEIDMIVEQQN